MSAQQCGGCDTMHDDGCGPTMAGPSEVHAEKMDPPYRQSVCMVIAQHPNYGKGTGVFCEYKGYLCIITGADLLHRPVAASKAFARFVFPGRGLPIQVSLRPEALFEFVGRRRNLVICACDMPSISAFAVTPAVPAPAKYAHTVSEFSRRKLVESLHAQEPSRPPARIANEAYTGGVARLAAVGESSRGHSCTTEVESQTKAYANSRARRCAVVPGSRTWRRPIDSDPIEPFSISVQDGAIYLELVVYCDGGVKRVRRLAVRSGAALPLDVGGELGSDEPGGHECQGEREGTKLGQDRIAHARIDDGLVTTYGAEAIRVVAVEREPLDGVHGGPVFLGGKLFGFVLQERVGEQATSVLSASSVGLLPPEELGPTQTRRRLAHGETQENRRTRALEKMVHIFRHGPASAMEAELSVAGTEELRELRAADGRSLVHLAAMSERVLPLEFVHLRLQMDVASEEVPGSGSTALHVAAYSGRVKCLEYIVAQGGDPWKRNRNGQTPAMFALLAGRKAALKWLLEHLPDGNTLQDTNKRLVQDLIDMMEDLDEAAVYNSPTYRLLDHALHAENSEREDTEDESAGEISATITDVAEVSPAAAVLSTVECQDAPDESPKTAENEIGFEQAWELYAKAEMGEKGMFGVLVGIHGEGVRSSWPRIVAALPNDVPRLVEDLEVERRTVKRDKIAAKTLPRGLDTQSRAAVELALSPDEEDEACLRSAVKSFLRGNMDANQLYREITVRTGGATLKTVLIAVARGMPEDKGWAMMEVHREHQYNERWSNANCRSSKRTAPLPAVNGTELGSGEGDFEDDESSVPSVFSVGTSNSLDGASTGTRTHPDLEAAVAQFRHGRMEAAELHALLSKTFGDQLDSIMPTVVEALPSKKRRELAKLSHKGKPHETLLEANRGNISPLSAGPPGIAADDHGEGSLGQVVPGKEKSVLARAAGREKRFKDRTKIAQPATGPAAGETLVKVSAVERASPFTTRASAWPGEQKEDATRKPPTCGKPRRARGGEGRDVSPGAAMDEVEGDGQDSEQESATGKNSAPTTDPKELVSDFAAGRLAVPHFFGSMLDTFGEEKLLSMVSGILKILPKDKADELQVFTAAAEGKAGAAAQSRLDRRLRQEKPQAEEEQKGKFQQDGPPKQVALEETTTLSKKGRTGAKEHHNTHTAGALGDGPAEKLPKIIKALPSGRATGLEAVSQTEEDEERRFHENQLDPWEITLADRRVYDKAFAKLDKDRNGFLSTTEARIPLRKAIGGSLTDHQLDEVWRLADTDEDGRLTREEWAIAYHVVRCVVKRDLQLPSKLPKALTSTVGDELPPV